MSLSSSVITFGPYRLDLEAVQLWTGAQQVPLQPRPLAVLCYLAARPGMAIGRVELLARVWDGAHVSSAVLKVAVRAIRVALHDDPTAPRYIQTVGRDGYRFVGVETLQTSSAPSAVPAMVGRITVMSRLRQALQRAAGGVRTIVLLTGEAGIGKTTLIDQFLVELEQDSSILIARGQCLEQYGKSEAYLPILEALARLARNPQAREVGNVLRHHAPTWAAQLPALRDARARRVPQAQVATPVPNRMLREMADALEVLTAQRPLVLVLEDLQWSDHSTIALVGYLARRRNPDPARLMVIGSARAAELIAHRHPLRDLQQELQAGGLCEEIALELLPPEDVGTYVATRFAGAPAATIRRLAASIHHRSEGNPLFMVNMVTDAIDRGPMIYRDGRWQVQGHIDSLAARVPVGLKAMIGHRIATLRPADRRTLEVASVVGAEFTVADLAAALRKSVDTVEATCSRLATQANFVIEAGVAQTPDGSVSGRYRFLHALYRRVLYDEIGAARRVRLHRAIGNHQVETMPRANEHAAQLAMHFTHGHDYPRALEFHELAGFAALERQAAREAAAHFTAALDVLGHDPELQSNANSELRIVSARATLSMALNGYAAPDTERDFARARTLIDGLADRRTVNPVLRGLLSFHHVRAELVDAYELGERLLRGAESTPTDDSLCVQAHYGHGATLFHQGALADAEMHLTAALTAYRPDTHAAHARIYGGYDPGVGASMWLAWTLALQGRLTEAVERDRAGLALARSLPYPFSLAWACYAASVSKQLFGDWAGSEALATEAVAIADEHGFPYVLGMATVNRGWAQVMQGKGAEGVALLRRGVAAVEATGARLVHPSYLGMLAAADAILGDRAAARRGFDAALEESETSGEGVHEATLLIGKSHFLSAGGVGGRAPRDHAGAAEACLHRALEVARGQGARLLELRAALALARHLQGRGEVAQARRSLEAVWPWFADQPPLAPEVGAARRLLAGQDT